MDGTEDLGTSVLTARYKVVFVGDVSVGKTSIMNMLFKRNEGVYTGSVAPFLL